MNYSKILEKASNLKNLIVGADNCKVELDKIAEKIYREPPETAPYFYLYQQGFNYEYARNLLLHFVESKGLSEECLKFMENLNSETV